MACVVNVYYNGCAAQLLEDDCPRLPGVSERVATNREFTGERPDTGPRSRELPPRAAEKQKSPGSDTGDDDQERQEEGVAAQTHMIAPAGPLRNVEGNRHVGPLSQ